MKTARAVLSGLALAIFCVGRANAQQIDVKIDPAQTQIHFTLGATMHTVHGTFRLKSGAMEFSAATGSAQGAIVIDATSGETGNSSRDHNMHEDVLKSAEYPTIIFVPQKVDGRVSLDGASRLQIQGVIQMEGAQHAVTAPAQAQIEHGHLKATLHLDVPYVKWGLKDPSTFILRVDKTVKIEVQAAGTVETSNR